MWRWILLKKMMPGKRKQISGSMKSGKVMSHSSKCSAQSVNFLNKSFKLLQKFCLFQITLKTLIILQFGFDWWNWFWRHRAPGYLCLDQRKTTFYLRLQTLKYVHANFLFFDVLVLPGEARISFWLGCQSNTDQRLIRHLPSLPGFLLQQLQLRRHRKQTQVDPNGTRSGEWYK